MKLIDKIKNHPAFQDIEDEGECCGIKHNYLVSLKEGFVDTENDCVSGLVEYTLFQIWYRLTHYVKHVKDIQDQRTKDIAWRALNIDRIENGRIIYRGRA